MQRRGIPRSRLAGIVRDVHVYGGAGLMALGLGWAWPPGGPIVLGFFLLACGVFWGRVR